MLSKLLNEDNSNFMDLAGEESYSNDKQTFFTGTAKLNETAMFEYGLKK